MQQDPEQDSWLKDMFKLRQNTTTLRNATKIIFHKIETQQRKYSKNNILT